MRLASGKVPEANFFAPCDVGRSAASFSEGRLCHEEIEFADLGYNDKRVF